MAKKATKYEVLTGFENDKTGARHEADTAVTDTALRKGGFTIKELLAADIIRPLEDKDDGNRKD